VTADRIAELLHEAAETHHVVYRIVDGHDPDWASWSADWLLNLSELPDEFGSKPVRSHLVHALVELDPRVRRGQPGRALGGLLRARPAGPLLRLTASGQRRQAVPKASLATPTVRTRGPRHRLRCRLEAMPASPAWPSPSARVRLRR
jgi:hypothetical protein